MTDVAISTPGAPARRRPSLDRVPVYAWLLALVILPNLLLFATSFTRSSGGVVVYELNFGNYASVFGSATVQLLALKTIVAAAISAALATLTLSARLTSAATARSKTTPRF